ncbi:AbrB/MazE/SpoVT family DNA-binding domain-containing protein [Shewanella surugensis]|uniref:AbrB/MazE/SpoVT family DNA-binding domain-containing protein n=1 Tax=Shewanella surugensis TaxID=212020 RepID=A0ABT0LG24_9GAMM|nr:AbrB/MazE/SpoVT family DNA-binding domain-containing protein [Shewanella surugensis]MCL1126325.1 AbrB/MazE/SpoVT family DNA-binding domain-containing protein [Shewanella surugensis]
MKIQIKKSGNSAAIRIPADVLKQLNLAIGEEMSMKITSTGMSFEKVTPPREDWFNDICPISVKNEANTMENDFDAIQNHSLDDWDHGDQW